VIVTLCHWWIVSVWLVFLIYWTIAAISVRRGLNRSELRAGMAMRLTLFVIIVAVIVVARRSPGLRALQWSEFHSLPMAVAGAIIATFGTVLAFAARAAIGRNWGPPATRRTDTELVTSGPYAMIRHPIYSGILLMMVGTAVGLLPAWWLVAAAAGIYFFVTARAEERYMAERFPETYPAYRARTKMLVPFLI
jgi:protein-S-isoprenylcysteine O-methyltransferase Ste14